MRYIYQENEPIEKHPIRCVGDFVVVINKKTGMPEVGVVKNIRGEVGLLEDGSLYTLSPYYWEIAWP